MNCRDELKPCPFCEAALSDKDLHGYHKHPSSDCLLSGYEFDDISAWNRRAQDVARAPEPVTSYCSSRFGKQPHAFNHQKCGYCGIAAPAAPAVAPTEDEKVMLDAVLYGTGFMKDGRHIPRDEVLAVPAQAEQQGFSKEWCMRMAALEPDDGVPPAGAAALADQQGATAVDADTLPTIEELETLWERHVGHPADFGAAVLETWGNWPAGMLGYGGSMDRASDAAKAEQPPTRDCLEPKTDAERRYVAETTADDERFRASQAEQQRDGGATLTDAEISFLALCIGGSPKLNDGSADDADGNAIWPRLESRGLVECIGNYRWKLAISEEELIRRAFNVRPTEQPSARVELSDEQRNVIELLISLARETFMALEDSEERQGDDGRIHVIDSINFDAVSDALDRLEELPDDRPGYTLNAPGKAEWALRVILDAGAAQTGESKC